MRPSAQSFLRYPLDRVFESPANVRVLRVLARHGGEMTTSRMMDQTGLTRVSVLAAVRRLAEYGVVEVIGSERQRLSRFNEKSPLSNAAKDLFAAEDASYADTIRAIRDTAERSGAEAVWIFGSVARSQDRSDSDVDIAVASSPRKAAAIKEALSDRLGERGDLRFSIAAVDLQLVARLERERDPWWLALKRDAITVMGPAPENYQGRAGLREKQGDDANRKRKKGRS